MNIESANLLLVQVNHIEVLVERICFMQLLILAIVSVILIQTMFLFLNKRREK